MNEWERLHQQAKRYQTEYPPGTRIMLLSMGRDPNPVEDQTRGTVKVPGTEDMEDYKDYCFHIKQSCRYASWLARLSCSGSDYSNPRSAIK